MEEFDITGYDLKVLATDISTKVLELGSNGLYHPKKLEKIPQAIKNKYFLKKFKNNEYIYEILPKLKELVLFKRLNLIQPPFPMKGQFDLIMCRNVMIYFDNVNRKKLIDEFYKLLKPGGYLLVGHSEGLAHLTSKLKCVSPTVYIKP